MTNGIEWRRRWDRGFGQHWLSARIQTWVEGELVLFLFLSWKPMGASSVVNKMSPGDRCEYIDLRPKFQRQYRWLWCIVHAPWLRLVLGKTCFTWNHLVRLNKCAAIWGCTRNTGYRSQERSRRIRTRGCWAVVVVDGTWIRVLEGSGAWMLGTRESAATSLTPMCGGSW